MRHWHARLQAVVTAFVLILLVSGCVATTSTRVLRTPDPGVRPVAHVNAIRDYDVAVATIAAVLERDFQVRPYPVDFHFFPDRRAFENGLVGLGYSDALARDTARTMDAVGGYRRVLLNEAALMRQPWPVRVVSLAHELTHSLQYELGGRRRGVSDQWLREGFAEWLALQVLHRLRGMRFSDARHRNLSLVRRNGRSNAPSLHELVTFPQWVRVNSRRGVAAYPQAFVAVDFLIERHGVAAVLDYFRRFETSQDRAGNFSQAFEEDLESFEAALVQRIW